MSFDDYLDSFLKNIALKRTGSLDTQIAYQRDIQYFLNFLTNLNITDLHQVTKLQVNSYLQDLKAGKITGNPLSNTSYARHLSSLKSFYKFLNTTTSITNNPVRLFKAGGVKRKLPEYLTYEQMERLLSTFDLTDPIELRNRCMIEVMYACGLRVSEVTNLQVNKINFQENYLSVIGKESKERMVPMYQRCSKLLEIYYKEVRFQLVKEENGYFFLNQRGKPLSSRYIQQISEQAGINANISFHIHPHMIRHSFATHLLDNGADLRIVQELLGHATLATTEIYTHVSQDKMKEVIEKAHPHSARNMH